jgi:hypothetical protein
MLTVTGAAQLTFRNAEISRTCGILSSEKPQCFSIRGTILRYSWQAYCLCSLEIKRYTVPHVLFSASVYSMRGIGSPDLKFFAMEPRTFRLSLYSGSLNPGWLDSISALSVRLATRSSSDTWIGNQGTLGVAPAALCNNYNDNTIMQHDELHTSAAKKTALIV